MCVKGTWCEPEIMLEWRCRREITEQQVDGVEGLVSLFTSVGEGWLREGRQIKI